MIVKRTIREQIQEYEYKGKEKKFDAYIQLKIEKDKKDKLIELSKEKGYSEYSKFLRDIIDEILS